MKNLILASTTALVALSLAGCGPKTEKAAADASNVASNAMDDASAMAGNAVEDVKGAVLPTPTGQEFINAAAKSDAFEIEAAKYDATNSERDDVKAFAGEMVKAHTESTAKIKAAAAEAKLTPDATYTDDQKKDLADLKALKGKDFDNKYVSGQVSAHLDALTLMQGYAKDGDTPSLKKAAGEIAPTVSHHLEMILAIDAKKD